MSFAAVFVYTTCMPSWPDIPTPVSATWIILTSLAPSPTEKRKEKKSKLSSFIWNATWRQLCRLSHRHGGGRKRQIYKNTREFRVKTFLWPAVQPMKNPTESKINNWKACLNRAIFSKWILAVPFVRI